MKRTKNHLQIIFLTGIIALLRIGMGGDTHARSLEEIRESKEIRICITPDLSVVTAEPADCLENCTFSGPVYEEVLAFTETLGSDVNPKFIKVEWDEQFYNKEGKVIYEAEYTPELLASGKCDIFPSNLTKTEWRAKKMEFVTVFPSRMMVIIHKSKKAGFKTAADLAEKRAAIVLNTSYYTWLQEQNKTVFKNNQIKIELVQSDEDATEMVMAGKADFTLIDSDKAIWIIRHKLKDAVVAFPVGTTDEIGWAFRKDDKELQAAVQKFFDEQRSETSVLNRIWEKYFGVTLNKFISIIKATN